MKRRVGVGPGDWKVDAYATPGGEKPALAFIQALEGRDKVEAIALVKLLEEQGNRLRRPQSGALGDGLFELRGKQVRLFYAFLPGRVAMLLDGEIKKRDDIPARTFERVRRLQADLIRRAATQSRRRENR